MNSPRAAAARRPDPCLEDVDDALHVVVVHAGGDIGFVTASRTRSGLARRVAEYVRERAQLLWPEDERRVQELLALGRFDEAGTHYFRTVGDRWDREQVVFWTVPARRAPR